MQYLMTARQTWAVLISTAVGSLSCADPPFNEPLPNITASESDVLQESSLFASLEENKLRLERLTAAEIAHSLQELEGVQHARVHLSLADHSILTKTPQKQSQAAILIVQNGVATPKETEIRNFVTAAVPDLKAENVRVFYSRTLHRAEPVVTVGFLRVSAASAPALKITLGILLLMCVLTASGLIVAGIKLRNIRRTGSH